jgi:predicted  nucleic acid-binding Zn-ribbon protein
MAEPIAALLELWSIDQRRRGFSRKRDTATEAAAKVEAAWKATDAAAAAAKAETERMDALIRQYGTDVERCDKTIADLAQKKLSAKSNKEYMDIHNGIEHARAEKTQREQSVKELATRKADLESKAQAAADKAAAVKNEYEAAAAKIGEAGGPTTDEQTLDEQAAKIRAGIDPEFLSVYERLIKSGHKTPLMRVDPKTRTTPVGAILSHNQIEQIRQGKLVIDRNTNAILYLG